MTAYIEQSLDVLIPAFAEQWATDDPDAGLLLDVIFRAFEKLKSDAQAEEPEPEVPDGALSFGEMMRAIAALEARAGRQQTGCHTINGGTTVYHGANCEHDTGDPFGYDGSEWRG